MGGIYHKRSLQNSPRNYNRSRTGKVGTVFTVIYWSGQKLLIRRSQEPFPKVWFYSGMYLFCDHLLWLHSVQLFRKSFCHCYLCVRRKLNKISSERAPPMISEKQGSQRDVVCHGWLIAPSYMNPNAGGGVWGSCGVSANEYSCAHGAQINFGNLTPYLTDG